MRDSNWSVSGGLLYCGSQMNDTGIDLIATTKVSTLGVGGTTHLFWYSFSQSRSSVGKRLNEASFFFFFFMTLWDCTFSLRTSLQFAFVHCLCAAPSVGLSFLHSNLVWDFVLLIVRITATKKEKEKRYRSATVLGNWVIVPTALTGRHGIWVLYFRWKNNALKNSA